MAALRAATTPLRLQFLELPHNEFKAWLVPLKENIKSLPQMHETFEPLIAESLHALPRNFINETHSFLGELTFSECRS